MTNVIRVAKIGKSALSNDPNDLIFNSELNTFKIITQATKSVALAASTANQSFTQAHGLGFIPLVTAFAKEQGVARVFPLNFYDVDFWAGSTGMSSSDVKFNYVTVDATNITFNFDNDDIVTRNIDIRYFCLEDIAVTAGVAVPGEPTNTNKIVVAKDGFNAITERSPRNLKFSSDYGTLKYFDKIQSIVTFTVGAPPISGRNIITHNLGYYPYVDVFCRVYIGSPAGNYEPAPFFDSGISVGYNGSYVIKENTIELYGDVTGVSSSTWNFDYLVFIYKNNLFP